MRETTARRRFSLARLSIELKRQRGRKDWREALRFAEVREERLDNRLPSTGQRIRKDPWAIRRFVTAASGRPRLDENQGAIGYSAFRKRVRDSKPTHRLQDPSGYVIAVLDSESGKLNPLDRTCLAAARQIAGLDSGVAVLALSEVAVAGLEEAGADRFSLIPGLRSTGHDVSVEDTLSALVRQLDCQSVVFCDSTIGRHSARTLATKIGVVPAIGAHELGEHCCVARCGAGECDAVYDGVRVVTAKEGFVSTAFSFRFEASALEIGLSLLRADGAIKDLGAENTPADQIPLEEAPFVLCGGAGIRDWSLFNRVAAQLNATRAGTRVVCDKGFLPRDRQVGASGSSSTATVYIALGLSGAVQHLQGIESCEEVIAINIDSAAPIVKRADTSYIADADEVMAELFRQSLEQTQ